MIWEFLQSPLYADFDRGLFYLFWTRVHCTVGDVLILIGSFWLTSLVFRSKNWIYKNEKAPKLCFILLGICYTAFSEWMNTTVRGGWEYADNMPVILWMGLTPLLQWIIIPLLVMSWMKK